MKPSFFIIGAARSGTTSLYAYLDQHPEIFFSKVKEINFFSNPKIWKKGYSWYESHFKSAIREKVSGEASTSYSASPFLDQAPNRLAKYSPDAKLIYIVRDPVDRIVSHYMHRVHRGLENRPFSELINNLEVEPTAWQGMYCYQLEQYLKVFEKRQIRVISFEDLRNHPDSVIKDTFNFLGVDSNFHIENIEKVYNGSSDTRKKSGFGVHLLRFYRRNLEQRRVPYLFKKPLLKMANIGSVRYGRPSLSKHDYSVLTQFYEDDVRKLRIEFNIDTNGWLRQS